MKNEINIKYLHIACYIYGAITNYDKSYMTVIHLGRKKSIDKDDVKILVHWLRKWGCRQFELKAERNSISNILKWYNNSFKLLPKYSESILNCSTDHFEVLFNSLMSTKASSKNIGQVGAAKILFALRPNVFAPWDDSIMSGLKYKGNGKDYLKYLLGIKGKLILLSVECKQKGYRINELPKLISRESSTLPKLIDEFYWVTITNRFDPKELLKIVNRKSLIKN